MKVENDVYNGLNMDFDGLIVRQRNIYLNNKYIKNHSLVY